MRVTDRVGLRPSVGSERIPSDYRGQGRRQRKLDGPADRTDGDCGWRVADTRRGCTDLSNPRPSPKTWFARSRNMPCRSCDRPLHSRSYRRLDQGMGFEHQIIYRRPVVLLLLGNVGRALEDIDAELRKLNGRHDRTVPTIRRDLAAPYLPVMTPGSLRDGKDATLHYVADSIDHPFFAVLR
jgi:hypothetical protein